MIMTSTRAAAAKNMDIVFLLFSWKAGSGLILSWIIVAFDVGRMAVYVLHLHHHHILDKVAE